MKKIFNLLTNHLTVLFVLLLSAGVSFGQCPAGMINVDLTYTGGTWDSEVGYALVDCSTVPATSLFCVAQGTMPDFNDGVVTSNSVCVSDGASLKLIATEIFGDGLSGATISATIAESGVNNNGCSVVTQEIGSFAGDDADGNGSLSCPPTDAELAAATSSAALPAVCPDCLIVCPDDILVENDPGICGALVECPPPGFDPEDCNLITEVGVVEINDDVSASFTTLPFAGDFDEITPGTYPVSIPTGGLCGVAMPDCRTELCIDIIIGGDLGTAGTETLLVTSTDFPTLNFDSDVDHIGDCLEIAFTFCLDAAGWDAVNADCQLDFTVDVVGGGINAGGCPFGGANESTNGIVAIFSMGTDCDNFSTIVTLPDGTEVNADDAGGVKEFPVGCSVVTYTSTGGTGSGTGSGGGIVFVEPGYPIECSYEVLVLDTEAPVISCPGDFTYNLQSGECCEVYDFEVIASDNCPPAAFSSANDFCDPCVAPTGNSSIGYPLGFNTHYISLVNGVSEGYQLTEVCYNQTFRTSATAALNVYCTDGITIPYDDGSGTFTPIASATFIPDAADNGECVCIQISGIVPADCTTLAVELIGEGDILVETSASCGATAATGLNTWLTSGGSVTPLVLGLNGFASDIGITIGGMTREIAALTATPPAGLFGDDSTVNAFESGDALPVGTHCFYYEVSDNAGSVTDKSGVVAPGAVTNTTSCSWCVVVNDVPNVTSSLTCDDHVNVSVDENCQVLITADMFLEGGPYSCLYDCYEVYIKDEHNHPVAATCFDKIKGEVDASDVSAFDVNGCTINLECGTYTYEVYDACRDNTCWGTFLVEDKLAPTIVDPADVTVSCLVSTAPVADCILSTESAFLGGQTIGLVVGSTATTTTTVGGLPATAVVDNITLDLEMSHSWLGDFTATLTAPDGTVVTLMNGECNGTGLMNVNATFDDTNGSAPTCTLVTYALDMGDCLSPTTPASITGLVTSDSGNLSTDFDGIPASGVWTIDIVDNGPSDGGCITAATLNMDYLIPGVPPATLASAVTYVNANGVPVDSDTPGAIAVGCDDDLTYVDDFFDGGCDGSFIIRTWVATDAKGNQSTTTQRIDIIQAGAEALGSEWFWPRDVVELNCGVDYSPEGIYKYFKANFQALTPCPDPESCDDEDDPYVKLCHTAGVIWAYPNYMEKDGSRENFVTNSCQMIFDYSDQLLGACGSDCPGNSKIIRTWTGLDWCTARTISATQVIHAKDTEGPVVDMGTDTGVQSVGFMQVGYSPWGCVAEFALPAPEHLTDNCSTVIDYTVSGPAPVSFVPVEGGNGYWLVSGAPKGTHTFTYTATDCCGNEGVGSMIVSVVDNTPPVVSTLQNIVVGLTFSPTNPEAGSAKVYAHMIDNGSHDGTCGIVRTAIRRLDGPSCGNDGLVINTAGDRHNNNTSFFAFRNDDRVILRDQDQPGNDEDPPEHDKDDTDEGEFVKFCCEDLFHEDAVDVDGDGVPDYRDIMVELGVWDDANCNGWPGTIGDRFSKSWAIVRLEAKVSPVLVCPPNAMITCDQDENSDLLIKTVLGSASGSSACGTTDVKYTDVCDWDRNGDGDFSDEFTMMGETVNEKFNKACHYGPIVRTWSIPGTSKSCSQIIIVKEPTAFFSGSYYKLDANGDYLISGGRPIPNDLTNAGSITWPYGEGWPNADGGNQAVDRELYLEDDKGHDYDDYAEVLLDCVDGLGDVEPRWAGAHCSLIGWSLESDTLNFEGDACKKIINKYCVIDWCQYDPNGAPSRPSNGDMRGNNEAPGKWCWTVIGKLLDPYAPTVVANDDMFPAAPSAGGSGGFPSANECVGNASMTAIGNDVSGGVDVDGDPIENACPSEWLKWVVLVDINNDWTYDWEYSSFVNPDDPSNVPFWTDTNNNGIPDVQVGESEFDNIEESATKPGDAYTINIPGPLPADCGETQHRVYWTVYDGCGNSTSTTSYFTVQDKKAPTPYCVNLSTALMDIPVSGGEAMVEIWAIDFNAGSFDNCTEDESLLFTFSDDPSTVIPEYRSAAMTFTCDDLAGGNPALLTLPVYVWDACGNRDFCTVNLRLSDNNDACGTGSSTGSAIAGTVMTEAGQTVENVEVMNAQMPTSIESTEMTSEVGEFAFYLNENDMDYQLTGSKNDDYLNGVSTIDLVMIQRHILGINKFDSPYEMIAADVNNDNVIDGRDLVELRKLILGIYSELPQNDSWRFGDATQTLDITNPWNFDETIDIAQLSASMMSEDFIGVKIGDVNGDVIANLNTPSVGASSSNVIGVQFEDAIVEAGQTVEITVNANLTDVYGYQFTLATPGLQLVNVESGSINVTEANFGVFGDVVTTSWNDTNAANVSDKLFTMTFKSTVAGQLSEILDLNSNVTKAEAYVGSNLDIVNINLENTSVSSAEFALNQNEPNPFSSTTVIGFQMAETADATMTVYDVTGKVVSVINGNYAKGYNEIELSKSDLGASGVLYYQFDSGEFTATKKMIIIE